MWWALVVMRPPQCGRVNETHGFFEDWDANAITPISVPLMRRKAPSNELMSVALPVAPGDEGTECDAKDSKGSRPHQGRTSRGCASSDFCQSRVLRLSP